MRRYKLMMAALIMLMVASALNALGSVVINEIMLNPPSDDPRAAEWVELYNSGPEAVDITGWKVAILSTPPDKEEFSWTGEIPVPPGTIPADGYLLLTGEPSWSHGFQAQAVLYDASGEEMDRSKKVEDNRSGGFTWSRFPNGGDNWAFIPETKGKANTIPHN